MSDRRESLPRARKDADRGDQQPVLEWIAEHSADVQTRDLARRALEAEEN